METEPEQRSIQTKQYKIRPLTRQRARQLYDYLIAYKTTHDGLSPGLQTISLELGYGSTNTVEYHLALLERAGCIKRTKYHHGIQLKGGQWLPPKHLPEFPDIILNSIYRYIVQYKRNNDGLSPPAVLIRSWTLARCWWVR
jgi:hypothetical protein